MNPMNNTFKQRFERLKKKYRLKDCFHADDNCNGKIIHAHSIQNNRVLNRISQDGLVYYFGQGDFDPDNMKAKTYGRKAASTFTGFCGHHDQMLFRPIDNYDYEPTNVEQEFLFAYRALAKEHHAKTSILSMFCEILETKNEPDLDYEMLYFYALGMSSAFYQLERMKIAFNKNLGKGNFFKIYTKRIILDEHYPLAVSSMFSPTTDFNGNVVNDLVNLKKDFMPIFMTVFPQERQTYILIQCLKNDLSYLNDFLNQVTERPEDAKLKISMLLLVHCENMAISPPHWDKLSEEQQNVFVRGFMERSLFSGKVCDYKKFEACNLFHSY
jgi:hypothetical protein